MIIIQQQTHLAANFKNISTQILYLLHLLMSGSPCNHLPNSEDNETTSISSHSSAPLSSQALSRELAYNVRKQFCANEAKYCRIIKEKPEFSITLYKPAALVGEKVSLQQLSIQLDKLMEDQYTLDKELGKITVQNQEKEDLKQAETDMKMDHYSFLRTVWRNQKEYCGAQDQLTALNTKIGAIRGHINNMISLESSQAQISHFTNVTTKEYRQLSKKYNQLHKSYQQETQKNAAAQKILQQQIQQLKLSNTEKERSLQKNREIKKNSDEQMIKLKENIQLLQIQILKRQREIRQLTSQQKKMLRQESAFNHQLKFYSQDELLTVTIKSNLLEKSEEYQTERKIPEIRSFLMKNFSLQHFVQWREKSDHSHLSTPQIQGEPNSQKIQEVTQGMDKLDRQRQLIGLGSQEKKRRFERTRNFE